MLSYFQDYKALLGPDRISNLAGLEGENAVFQLLSEDSPLEGAEIAALGGRRAIRLLLRQVLETPSLANLVQQILRLGLGRCQRCVRVGRRGQWRSCVGSRRWGSCHLGRD